MSSPSSPPLAPSSPPYSPFSCLPFELAEYIIEATLPLRVSVTTYRVRQKTLLSLCLVSRLFHQISKPLLFAVVRISSQSRSHWLSNHEEEEVDSSSKIRELIVYFAGRNVKFDDLRPIFRTQLHITKLVLLDVPGEVDFAVLSQMNHLTLLRFHSVVMVAASPFTLPRLSELFWVFVKAAESWTSNFNSRSFPSLHTVSIMAPINRDNGSKTILEVLSTQVDVIAVDTRLVSQLSPDFFARIKHKTLVESADIYFKLTTHIPYLRVRTDLLAAAETFAKLSRFVEDMPSSTSSTILYLPLHLSLGSAESLERPKSRQSLLDQCSAKKIEVIFEEQPTEWDIFWQVSADFRKKMKEKKMRE